MPRLLQRNPKYSKHRASGQALVSLDGKRVYLGPHGTKASKSEYDRVVAEWLANGRRLPHANGSAADITIAEIIDRYWIFAEGYYKKPDGTPSSELHVLKAACRPLNRLYGDTPAASFGPLALESVRNAMIGMGWCRGTVNSQIGRVRAMMKWAVAKELIPASVHHGLTAVSGLRAGRSDARESIPVTPVSDESVAATLPFLSRVVRAMVKLQRLTGARPGEICIIRTGDIDRSGDVWVYTPRSHKTSYIGHKRTIFIGPKGQEVLRDFLRLDPNAFCFSPVEADQERRDKLNAARKTPLDQGNGVGTNRKRRPKRTPDERYDTAAYNRAIVRACEFAFPAPAPLGRLEGEGTKAWKKRLTAMQRAEVNQWRKKHGWHVHQLRHSSATEIRKRFGLEAAGAVLGHSELSVTELYAQRNDESARNIASAIG